MAREIRYIEPPATYGIEGDDSQSEYVAPLPEVVLAEDALKVIRGEMKAGKSFLEAHITVRRYFTGRVVDAVLADVFTGHLPNVLQDFVEGTPYPRTAAALKAQASPTTKELIVR